jgi:hypothetical protein
MYPLYMHITTHYKITSTAENKSAHDEDSICIYICIYVYIYIFKINFYINAYIFTSTAENKSAQDDNSSFHSYLCIHTFMTMIYTYHNVHNFTYAFLICIIHIYTFVSIVYVYSNTLQNYLHG